MSKKVFKITIMVETTEDFDQEDFALYEDDVIDGFQLTRSNNDKDVTEIFQMKDAYIQSIQEL